MKAIILAGGFGSRLSEETTLRPKPMVEIGDKPILWHIMNIFAAHGVTEFIIALGYKGDVIKRYFMDFNALNNDLTVDLASGALHIHDGHRLDWKVHLVETGLNTGTGGRIKRLAKWLRDDDAFLMTYGDGVADLDVTSLIKFHQAHGKLATVTTVHSPARFGRMHFVGDQVTNFYEKAEATEGWINGGFFVLNRRAVDYIADDATMWEREPVEGLARNGELMGYRHAGFWSCMDTLKEKTMLDDLWNKGNAPWQIRNKL